MSALQGFRSVRRHGSSRRLAVSQFAQRHGLAFGDTMRPTGLPSFTSLDALIVDQWGIENSLLGTWQGVHLLAGDLWSRDPAPDGGSSGPRSYRSIAIVPGAGHLPFIRVQRVGVLRQALDTAAGFRVRFESEEFNQHFEVDADSNETAFTVIDERMMQWLLESAGPFTFETGIGGVLVTGDLVDPNELEAFLNSAAGFAAHVPRVAAISGPGPAAPVAGTPAIPTTPTADTTSPMGTTMTTTTSMGPVPAGGLGSLVRSPNRVVIQTNLFGFHSSDSIAGGELGNAFRDGTWSRDPHLRRFVLRQGSLLVLPFVAIGIIDALIYGMWLPIVMSLLSVGLVILSLRKSFHR